MGARQMAAVELRLFDREHGRVAMRLVTDTQFAKPVEQLLTVARHDSKHSQRLTNRHAAMIPSKCDTGLNDPAHDVVSQAAVKAGTRV